MKECLEYIECKDDCWHCRFDSSHGVVCYECGDKKLFDWADHEPVKLLQYADDTLFFFFQTRNL